MSANPAATLLAVGGAAACAVALASGSLFHSLAIVFVATLGAVYRRPGGDLARWC